MAISVCIFPHLFVFSYFISFIHLFIRLFCRRRYRTGTCIYSFVPSALSRKGFRRGPKIFPEALKPSIIQVAPSLGPRHCAHSRPIAALLQLPTLLRASSSVSLTPFSSFLLVSLFRFNCIFPIFVFSMSFRSSWCPTFCLLFLLSFSTTGTAVDLFYITTIAKKKKNGYNSLVLFIFSFHPPYTLYLLLHLRLDLPLGVASECVKGRGNPFFSYLFRQSVRAISCLAVVGMLYAVDTPRILSSIP